MLANLHVALLPSTPSFRTAPSGIRQIASEFTIDIRVVRLMRFCRLSPVLQNWTLANFTKRVLSGDFSLKGAHALVPFDEQTD